MIRRLYAAILLTLIFAVGCNRGGDPKGVGKIAPMFVVSDGVNTADLNGLRGRVVLLNFWATYCATCIGELPSLIELHRRMPKLAIIAVSWDEDESVYRHFLTRNHIDLLTVRDPNHRVGTLYGTALIPETYVIDRSGVLRRKFVSSQDWTNPEMIRFLGSL